MTAIAAADPSPWTPQACAEDLLARCEDAIVAGVSDAALLEALADEGLRPSTVAALVAAIRCDLAGPNETQVATTAAPSDRGAEGAHHVALELDLWRLRSGLRAQSAPWRIDPERRDALQRAFVDGGLPTELAADLVDDIAAVERAMHVGFAHRQRRLGLQGMAVGVGGAAVMALAGSAPGAARWHLVTAAAAAGLATFAFFLWRQARARIADPR